MSLSSPPLSAVKNIVIICLKTFSGLISYQPLITLSSLALSRISIPVFAKSAKADPYHPPVLLLQDSQSVYAPKPLLLRLPVPLSISSIFFRKIGFELKADLGGTCSKLNFAQALQIRQ
jgi:hypothetical protein